MTSLLNEAIHDPITIAITVVIVAAIFVLIWTNRKDVLLKSALYIVAEVEDEWGSNTGRIKFAQAYEYVKCKYPIITFFMSKETLTNIIETALVQLKEILKTKEAKERQELEEDKNIKEPSKPPSSPIAEKPINK